MKRAITAILLVCLITALGCVKSTDTPNKEVTTLDLSLPTGASWDADAETDGIEVYIQPRNANDRIVEANGTLSAKLYESKYESLFSTERVKGDLVQEWSNISINKSDFSWNGILVRLEYTSGFKPKEVEYGWLEVTLSVDGKEFETERDLVRLDKS